MTTRIRWLFSAACFAVGLYLLNLSFRAYANLQESLTTGDMSLVEAYEIEFWSEVSVALFLILLSAFLAGRWSFRAL